MMLEELDAILIEEHTALLQQNGFDQFSQMF
jgi:hypothetical protein